MTQQCNHLKRCGAAVAVLVCFTSAFCTQEACADKPKGKMTAKAARRYAGVYEQDGLNNPVRIELRRGYLTALLPGRSPVRLLKKGKHEFAPEHMKQMRIKFTVTGKRSTGYAVNHNGKTQNGKRLDHQPAAGKLVVQPRTLQAANGREIKAEQGILYVPENRSDKDSHLISLSFVRLISTSTDPRPPLVYLHGGPGGTATNQVREPSVLSQWSAFLEICDVILLDQRGCGGSSPRLLYKPGKPPRELFADRKTALRYMTDAVDSGAKHLRRRGIDLQGYTTVESADDLNDLRKALGVDKISLLGFSYGTHLAQSTIRRHGPHLENVVICGVEGLDMTHKFPLNMDTQIRKLSLMVAQDPQIADDVPNLYALTKRVLKKLAKEPMIVEVTDRRSRKRLEIPIGKFGLQMILRFDVGDASDLVVFPRLLHAIDKDDPSLLRWFVQKRIGMFQEVNLLTWVMDGASGAPAHRWARIEAEAEQSLFDDIVNFPYPSIKEAIGDIDVGDDFRKPLVSDVRTLFLSGTLDWNTPPYQAERVRWGFSNSTHIIVENAGHEQILPLDAIQMAIRRFLAGEEVNDVTASLPPLQFVPIKGRSDEVSHPSVRG